MQPHMQPHMPQEQGTPACVRTRTYQPRHTLHIAHCTLHIAHCACHMHPRTCVCTGACVCTLSRTHTRTVTTKRARPCMHRRTANAPFLSHMQTRTHMQSRAPEQTINARRHTLPADCRHSSLHTRTFVKSCVSTLFYHMTETRKTKQEQKATYC